MGAVVDGVLCFDERFDRGMQAKPVAESDAGEKGEAGNAGGD